MNHMVEVWKVVWRFASTTHMEASVTHFGMTLMLLWFASSLNIPPMVSSRIAILFFSSFLVVCRFYICV